MDIPNYDKSDKSSSKFKWIKEHPYMPKRTFRMLISGPSGCGKTNLLYHIIRKPLVYFDKIYLFSKSIEQDKMQMILDVFDELTEKVGYNIVDVSNDEVIPLNEFPIENQKLVIFDDFLNDTNKENREKINEYFTGGRNRNCSCIYISQGFFQTPRIVRINCSHFCVFGSQESADRTMISKNLLIKPEVYDEATKDPFSFLWIDRQEKKFGKNFLELK